MPVLEIITIGTELLLGEITDTNSTYIARTLRDHGIDIYRITTIGDNPGRIATTIQEALGRADIIITTGGLGPTIDDPTRQAVAQATFRDLVFDQELWEQILERFKVYDRVPTENNRRQAFIPEGAIPIPNPVGTAPCFIIEQDASFVISLPGVPQEMKHLLHQDVIPFLKQKFNLQSHIIKATVLHAASLGESVIDELIADLEVKENPSVGLLAHPGQVDIRVTAKASSEGEANQMIQPILEDLHNRLGDHIYGHDEVTLEDVISRLLGESGNTLGIVHYGLDPSFGAAFLKSQPQQVNLMPLAAPPQGIEALAAETSKFRQEHDATFGFGLALMTYEHPVLLVVFQDETQTWPQTSQYGGPMGNGLRWAKNVGLDTLRRNLMQFTGNKRQENHD
jgi:nicotinamide-nucleotide amidase